MKAGLLLRIHLAVSRVSVSPRVSSLAPNYPGTGNNIWCVLYGSPSPTSGGRGTGGEQGIEEGIKRKEREWRGEGEEAATAAETESEWNKLHKRMCNNKCAYDILWCMIPRPWLKRNASVERFLHYVFNVYLNFLLFFSPKWWPRKLSLLVPQPFGKAAIVHFQQ